MKKYLYSVLALAGILAVSCKKEAEAPVNPVEDETVTYTTYTFKGILGEESTRTAYSNDKTFSWKAQDEISVFTYNEDEGYYQIATFTAQEDGVTTTFVGEVEDGYIPGPMAVYPDEAAFIEGEPAVYLNSIYYVDEENENYDTVYSDNPLSYLALVGFVNDDGTAYAFQTAMGAIKLTFTNLSSDARFLRIYSPDEKISGYFHLDENGNLTNETAVPGYWEYTDDEGQTQQVDYSRNNIWFHFTPASDGTATIYVPLPVGKLSAGTTFFIEDEDEEVLFRKTTTKDITVERNKVTVLTPLVATVSWKNLGTGKFYDSFTWQTSGWTTGAYVDVTIQADENDSKHFRVVNPYGTAIKKFRASTLFKPSSYFELYIDNDGYVDYPLVSTGMKYSNFNEATWVVSPSMAYGEDKDPGLNLVAKYLDDGVTPANILIAPTYYWNNAGRWSGDSYYFMADMIQIVFPGAAGPIDVTSTAEFKEIADDSVDQPVALVDVAFGSDVTALDMVIAKDIEDARAAAAAGQIGGTANTSNTEAEVLLPADAPTNNYYIYSRLHVAGGSSLINSKLIPSTAPFQYIRADTEDISIESILGTYTATDAYIYFNKTYWDAINAGEEDPEDNEDDYSWYSPYTVSFTLEESDDEGLGDVMMTAFTENAIDFCTIETPIYATFDAKTGTLTFAPMQPIYSFENSNGELVEVQLANADGFGTENLVFELSLDRTSYRSKQYFGYVVYFTEQEGFNYYDIWFDDELTLVKETASPAPAKAQAPKAANDSKFQRVNKPFGINRVHVMPRLGGK